MRDLFLIGRMIFGGFFAYSGINHFLGVATMADYAATKGVPAPELAVILSGALLVFGAFSVLFGLLPRIGLTLHCGISHRCLAGDAQLLGRERSGRADDGDGPVLQEHGDAGCVADDARSAGSMAVQPGSTRPYCGMSPGPT